MSTIRVDNFGPSAGGTTYSARGIAKAWVNFNGTGTVSVRDSENVSSLIDGATGFYTLNLSNAFAAADYPATTSITNASVGAYSNLSDVGPTTTAFSVYSLDSNSVLVDIATITASAHGDLA